MRQWAFVFAILMMLLTSLLGGRTGYADEVDRMTKEELKSLLGSRDLVLLDVRTGKDCAASEFKIKGAMRAEPQATDEWAPSYDKEKTVVVYCA